MESAIQNQLPYTKLYVLKGLFGSMELEGNTSNYNTAIVPLLKDSQGKKKTEIEIMSFIPNINIQEKTKINKITQMGKF